MVNNFIFILVMILLFIFINFFDNDNFQIMTTKYNVILINHKNYQIFIFKNINNIENKIFKIYKN
jgi:hypothetical protein